jgi:hypothetical protein
MTDGAKGLSLVSAVQLYAYIINGSITEPASQHPGISDEDGVCVTWIDVYGYASYNSDGCGGTMG